MQDLSTQRLILILQSELTHVQLIQDAFNKNDKQIQVIALTDTQDALDFLCRRGPYADSQRPDLILLDLDLAGETTGYELLSILKKDRGLRRIPIIVLTLSKQGEDIFKTYAAQGNCYVIHPGDREQLARVIQCIEEFWLTIVTLPNE